MKNVLVKILIILLSSITVISLNMVLDKDVNLYESFYGNNVFFIVELILIIKMLYETNKVKDNRLKLLALILSIIYAMIHIIGNSINIYGSLEGIISSSNTIIKFILRQIGESTVFYVVTVMLFKYIEKIANRKSEKNCKKISNKKVFLISFIIILVCWIPYFITYYPGLTTGDSLNQIMQAIGNEKLSGHHPLIHTGIISISINLGYIIKDYNLGIAIYTMIQMVIMSTLFSYTIYYMKKVNAKKTIIIISLLFYCLYPINPLFSLIMWKDIIFAGLMLLFVINTHKFVASQHEKISIINIINYVINIILLCLFRNNGVYVILLMIPFIFILKNKNTKIIANIFIVALVVYYIINAIIYNVLGVSKGQVREALSIPMQQFARILKYNKEDLSTEDKEKIYKFIPNDKIEELYIPTLSDPVKNYFDSEEFSNNKIEFMKLWARLIIKFPRTCIESFLCNSYGYWYPEAQSWVANRDVEPNELGIYQRPIVQIDIVKKIDSLIERRNIPIVSMFFSIGFFFWCILFLFVYCIYRKKYQTLLIFMPILGLWLTTLASPVFCEFRYVYSLVTCLPFLTMSIFEDNK